jgi:hypothetical protein
MANEPAVADPPWPPPPPPETLACPKCQAKVEPKAEVQTCRCGLRFTLQAGPLLDASLTPAATGPESDIVRVNFSGAVLRQFGQLDAMCVQAGSMDPVTGHIPLDGAKLAYKAVYSVAFWRKLPVGSLVAWILLALPWALFSLGLLVSTREPGVLIFAVPMTLITVWAGYQIIGVRAHWARVVGPKMKLLIRYDKPGRRRVRFHDELLRRCGIRPSAIP